MIAFLLCLAVILIFVLAAVVPKVSQLLELNAVERTRETVLQAASGVEIYLDSALTALHHASGLLPEEPLAAETGRSRPSQPSTVDLVASPDPSAMAVCRPSGSVVTLVSIPPAGASVAVVKPW